jgi:hypothetical protein
MTLVRHVLSVKGAVDLVHSQASRPGEAAGPQQEAADAGTAVPAATPRGAKGLGGQRGPGCGEEEERDWEQLVARAAGALDGLAQRGEQRERELQDAQLQLRLVRDGHWELWRGLRE